MRKVIALLLSTGGIVGSVYLKHIGTISELSFLVLISISVLVGLFVCYSDRVSSINLKKGELILSEMKETESSVKELGRAVLEVTEALNHTRMLESFDSNAHKKAIEKLRGLVA